MSEEVDMLAQRVAALEVENAHLKALLVQLPFPVGARDFPEWAYRREAPSPASA